jgi:branched-chain amino acid transport system permease protein
MGSEKRFALTKGLFIPVLILSLGFLVIAPHITSYYITSLMCIIFFYIALAQGLNVLTGFTGYVNFGYAGWVGLGSYATMIFLNRLNMHWLPAFFLSGLFSMLVGVVVGHPLLKIRGIYFAIAAFTFAEGIRFLVSSELLSPLTHGGEGVSVNNPGLPLTGQYYVGLAVAAIAIIVVYKVSTSRFGLRLLAIKGEELPTQCLGINTTMHKVMAFAISSFFAGTVGGLMAVYTFFITPESTFSVEITLQTILMLNLGGGGTVIGPVFAAISLTLVSELLWSKFVFLHTGILGIVLVLVILFLPEGVVPWLQDRKLLPFSRKL